MRSVRFSTLRAWLRVGLAGVLLAVAGCGHVAWTKTTAERPAGLANAADDSGLVLRVTRHLDTVINGPDIDEDQTLVLTVRDYKPGERVPIPSARVTAQFEATRFGPSSEGESFTGFVMIRKVTPTQVQAYVAVTVKAATRNDSYHQTAKFTGDYVFQIN